MAPEIKPDEAPEKHHLTSGRNKFALSHIRCSFGKNATLLLSELLLWQLLHGRKYLDDGRLCKTFIHLP